MPEMPKRFWEAKDYQKRAVRLLVSSGCGGMLLDPGLGKTSISLAAFSLLKKSGINKRMLVIAPLRPLLATWPAEMKKWADFADLRYAIVHGPKKEEMLSADADVFLINPDAMQWLREDGRWKRINADILCVDESTKFKNGNSKRFKALREMLSSFRRRWILTGSPAPNGLLDLFGQIFILDQGNALGRFITHYRNTFFYPSGFGGYNWNPKPGAEEDIAERINPLVLRLKAEDWIQMPELIFQDIAVELPSAARKVYTDVEHQFFTTLAGEDIVAANAAVAGGKCRQIANGGLYSGIAGAGTGKRQFHAIHNAKVDALVSLVEELQGQPLLVLYEFDHDRERIQAALPGTPAISGGTSDKKSGEYIDAFNKGMLPILLAQPGSAAWGLNLQEVCFRVCWFGMTWNLEHYDQATRRVWRQGQKSSHVIVYRIIAQDTLDEVVVSTLASKDKTQSGLMSLLKTLSKSAESAGSSPKEVLNLSL
jgi:SNF2 family DNA or RNA helicase